MIFDRFTKFIECCKYTFARDQFSEEVCGGSTSPRKTTVAELFLLQGPFLEPVEKAPPSAAPAEAGRFEICVHELAFRFLFPDEWPYLG